MEQKFQAESRPKHREKSSVLRRRLKADSDGDARRHSLFLHHMFRISCQFIQKFYFIILKWRGGAVGGASDLLLIGSGFESCLGTIVKWPWSSYLHLYASVTKQYNFVSVKAGE